MRAGSPPPAITTVPVTAEGASYEVKIGAGLLGRLGELNGRPATQAVVVCDENVAPLYLERVVTGLEAAGTRASSLVLPPGEQTKTQAALGVLYDRLYDLGVGRGDAVVALGGGVIGDLAGYAAATFLRGVCLVQAPTTLLAMVDAAVGGKVAVDFREGKNYLGTFYQPRLVVEDPDTLTTLPEREVRGGWAEVVKHGLLAGGDTLALTEEGAAHPSRPDPRLLEAERALQGRGRAARPARDRGRPRGAQLRAHGRSRHRGGRRLCALLARRGGRAGAACRAVALSASRGPRPGRGRTWSGAACRPWDCPSG